MMRTKPDLGRDEPLTLPEGPIGLLSDAHGDSTMARRGVAALVRAGDRSSILAMSAAMASSRRSRV